MQFAPAGEAHGRLSTTRIHAEPGNARLSSRKMVSRAFTKVNLMQADASLT